MNVKRLLLALVIVGIAGCASSARTDRLDATLRAYERAVRWSEFQNAFAIAGQADAPTPDYRHLRDIKVVSYERIGVPRPENDGRKLSQAIEIRYVNIHHMSERVFADQQEWVYVEQGERWKLTSPFPSFK